MRTDNKLSGLGYVYDVFLTEDTGELKAFVDGLNDNATMFWMLLGPQGCQILDSPEVESYSCKGSVRKGRQV